MNAKGGDIARERLVRGVIIFISVLLLAVLLIAIFKANSLTTKLYVLSYIGWQVVFVYGIILFFDPMMMPKSFWEAGKNTGLDIRFRCIWMLPVFIILASLGSFLPLFINDISFESGQYRDWIAAFAAIALVSGSIYYLVSGKYKITTLRIDESGVRFSSSGSELEFMYEDISEVQSRSWGKFRPSLTVSGDGVIKRTAISGNVLEKKINSFTFWGFGIGQQDPQRLEFEIRSRIAERKN